MKTFLHIIAMAGIIQFLAFTAHTYGTIASGQFVPAIIALICIFISLRLVIDAKRK